MRRLLIAGLLLGLFGLGSEVQAKKLCFGTDEQLIHVQNVTAKGQKGEPLALARKLRRDCFVAPYTVADEGYVLQVIGETTYYSLPPERIAELQRTGGLPTPLPPYTMDWVEFLFGHLLWIVIGVMLLWVGLDWLRKRRAVAT